MQDPINKANNIISLIEAKDAIPQILESIKIIGQPIKAYFDEMLRLGFDPDQALKLTISYQETLLGVKNK